MKKHSSPSLLLTTLLRVGRNVSRGAESGRLRLVALCVASLALSLSLASFVVVTATYHGREEAQADRTPQVVSAADKDQAIARWKDAFDTIDGEQYSVVYIEPLKKDAPPPPGLREWPEPGHAVISLGADLDGADEAIASRFGVLDGHIDPGGLASAGEHLAYVRPLEGFPGHAEYVSGWGDPDGPVFGEPLFVQQPATSFFYLVTATLLAPALALTVIAARTGSSSRDRRRAVLHALGTSRRHRLCIDLGEAAPAIVVGAALAALALWVFESTNWPLPWVSYDLTAGYLPPYRATLYGCVFVAAAFVLAAAVLLQPRVSSMQSVRPRLRDRRTLLKTAAWLCPVAFALAVFGPGMLGADDNESLFLLPYSIGALTALLALPALLSLLAGVFGRTLARFGTSANSPAALLAGRWISASPSAVARIVISVVMVMGLASMLYTWSNRITDTDRAAVQLQAQLDGSVVEVEGSGLEESSLPRISRFVEALPAEIDVLSGYATPGSDGGAVEIVGTRQALSHAGLPSTRKSAKVTPQDALTPRGRALVQDATESGTNTVRVTVGPPSTTKKPTFLHALSATGGKLAPQEVKRVANRHLTPGWTAEPPGYEWTTSLLTYQNQSRWLMLFAMPAIGLLAFATCLANAAEFLRFGRSMAPIGVITGSRALFVKTAVWVFMSAFSLAAALGAGAAVVLTLPMQGPPVNANGLPATLMATGVGVVAVIAVIMTCWSAWVTLREAARWKPARD
ncbi:FtsX-like permease family protein [Streptomyces smyrnaeus]|uniref:FtsX-like permease family protein n=1 Tax=Streptomyces smyrnaeus TaxID=1387713 RepID=UPI003675CD4D